MIEITKWPVVIVCSPRTGSNVLTDTIAKQYNAKWFYEPGQTTKRLSDFLEFRKGTNIRYIAKIFPGQRLGDDVSKELLNESGFKIKLTRENVIDQIVSFYVAHMRDIWDETNRVTGKYILPINYDKIAYAIEHIVEHNRLLDACKAEYDLELTYESLGYVENTEFKLTVQPVNIDKIKEAIVKVYGQ